MTQQTLSFLEKLFLVKTPEDEAAVLAYKAKFPKHKFGIGFGRTMNRPSARTEAARGYYRPLNETAWYQEEHHVGYKQERPIANAIGAAIVGSLIWPAMHVFGGIGISYAQFNVPPTKANVGEYTVVAMANTEQKVLFITENGKDYREHQVPYVRLSTRTENGAMRDPVDVKAMHVMPGDKLAQMADFNKLDTLYKKVFTDPNRKQIRN